jgi:hypothetical protein
MINDDKIITAYLQAAHNRGGSFHMAMGMMVQRIEVLEDKLQRAGIEFEPDRHVSPTPTLPLIEERAE